MYRRNTLGEQSKDKKNDKLLAVHWCKATDWRKDDHIQNKLENVPKSEICDIENSDSAEEDVS